MPSNTCRNNDAFLENHHLASTTVLTDSSRYHQQMLKVVTESLIRRCLHGLKKIFINNFSGETWQIPLNQVMTFTPPVMGQFNVTCLWT